MNIVEICAAGFSKIIEGSIAASLLAVLVFGIQRALGRRLSPAWRFALWVPVLFRLVLPFAPESPASVLNLPRWIQSDRFEGGREPLGKLAEGQIALQSRWVQAQGGEVVIEADRSTFAMKELVPKPGHGALRMASIIWLAVAAAFLIRLFAGSIWLSFRLRKNRSTRDLELMRLLARSRCELRTCFEPEVIETPLVQSPCLFGITRPKILLPIGLGKRLTKAELSDVFLHELAHLRRGDHLLNWCMAIANALHWFNPVVGLVLRRMRMERELACDRIVLEARPASAREARAYGETLLKLLHGFSARVPVSAAVGVLEDMQALKLRIRQIAEYTPAQKGVSRIAVPLLALLVATGLSNAQSERPEKSKSAGAGGEGAHSESGATLDLQVQVIETLEREYQRRRKEVEELQSHVDKLRAELRISDLDESFTKVNGRETGDALQQLRFQMEKTLSYEKVLLQQLRGLSRAELKGVLPTVLRPPDEHLNRYLADLGRAEQQYTAVRSDLGEEHPESRRLTELIKKIETQIEDRIEGILAGLEIRVEAAATQLKQLTEKMAETEHADAERRKQIAPYFAARGALEHAQRILDTIYMRMLAEKAERGKIP